MQIELINMQKRNVQELIPRTNGMKTVKSKRVYSIKKNEEGGDVKFKTKLVAVGTGIYYKRLAFTIIIRASTETGVC